MARVVSGPEITGVVVSRQTGSPIGRATVTVSQTVYTDPDFTSGTTTLTANGYGEFFCYAGNGTYTFTTTAPGAAPIEPVTVRGTGGGGGGGGGGGVTATVDGTNTSALALTTGVVPADIGAARQVPTWAPSTTYKAGELVVNAGLLYTANADFTSGATFNGANWTGVGSVNAVYGSIPPDYGYGAWTGDPVFFPTGLAPTAAGVVHVYKIKVPLTITITNIILNVFTAGTGLSNCYAAVYDSTGAQLGVTADQTTNWSSAGLRTAAIGTPVVVQGGAGVSVYVALLVGAATALPLFYKTANGSTLQFTQSKVGGAARMGLYGSSLTAMPASLTLASITAGAYSFWAATS